MGLHPRLPGRQRIGHPALNSHLRQTLLQLRCWTSHVPAEEPGKERLAARDSRRAQVASSAFARKIAPLSPPARSPSEFKLATYVHPKIMFVGEQLSPQRSTCPTSCSEASDTSPPTTEGSPPLGLG